MVFYWISVYLSDVGKKINIAISEDPIDFEIANRKMDTPASLVGILKELTLEEYLKLLVYNPSAPRTSICLKNPDCYGGYCYNVTGVYKTYPYNRHVVEVGFINDEYLEYLFEAELERNPDLKTMNVFSGDKGRTMEFSRF
ncbi:hypothetical protein ACFL08_02700 [Patescibacteria group bacterium]